MNGPAIKAARERLELKQFDLAKLIGTTAPWLSKVESGQREVPWYLPIVVGLLEQDREAIPALLSASFLPAGAPAYFVTMVKLATRSQKRSVAVTQWIAGEVLGGRQAEAMEPRPLEDVHPVH